MRSLLLTVLFSCFLLVDTIGQTKPEEDKFLIGIYVPPPLAYTNDEQYKAIHETHIDNIQNTESTDLNTVEINFKMLDLAKKYDMKVFVSDPRVRGSDDEIREMVKTFKDHPAVAGYYIRDEPDSSLLDWAIKTYRTVAAADPTRTPYVNLFPDFAVQDYEKKYVEKWIEGVGAENLKYLSFDNYPFKTRGRFEKTYYNNLDIIRRAGLKYGVKTSAYLQSFGMGTEFRRPNKDELRYSAYTILAYGIKNPVWFCYWTPNETFTDCIIDPKGNKTDLYEYVKEINWEMKQLGPTLIHLNAEEVYHTGDSLHRGTQHPPADFLLQPTDKKSEVVLTYFKDQKSPKKYVMVVNRSFKYAKELSFEVKGSVRSISEISKKDGKKIKSPFDKKKHLLSQRFLPGEGRLYEIVE